MSAEEARLREKVKRKYETKALLGIIDEKMLLKDFIREALEEPDAGGKWDMLRVRARIGADLPVNERFAAGRVNNPTLRDGEMWRKWMFDILLTLLAAAAVAWKGRDIWAD